MLVQVDCGDGGGEAEEREKKEEEEVKIEKIESLFLSIARELNIDFNPFGNVQRNKISKGL